MIPKMPDNVGKVKRIAIDMDDVLADTSQRTLDWYNRDFGGNVKRGDYNGMKLHEYAPAEHRAAFKEYGRHPDFFRDLDVIPESPRVVQALMERYEVFIVTAAMPFPNSYMAKYEWLKAHFPFISIQNVVYCGFKYMIDADFMIDDHSFNFQHFKGKGVLYTCEHNAHEDAPDRVDNWFDVENYFL